MADVTMRTPICDLLDIQYPIVLAGMGSAASPELAAAVSNAGGLGVLRAALATRMDRARATGLAATIGQGLAFLFGFLGLVSGNAILVFIAIFIYLAASAEAQATGLQDAARTMGVRDAMITQFEALGPHSTVGDAANALIRTTQHEFPVVDGSGRLRLRISEIDG